MKGSFPERPLVLRTPRAHLSAVLHHVPGTRLVILCHGFTGNKTESGRLFTLTARALQKAGLNALRFDFMGSGDSSGDFSQMSPNTQIQDALDVLDWGRRRYKKIALLGLSFGGATAICAASQARPRPDALITWSSVPELRWWRDSMAGKKPPLTPVTPGHRFWTNLPAVDVPEAYVSLDIPRFQIQGDRDLSHFRERFTAYCPQDDPFVRHLVLPGADHVFSRWEDRRRVIAESVRWLKKHLGK